MTCSTENVESLLAASDLKDINSKMKDFSSLLSGIESLDDKKKALWKEIYENAITDRQNAYVMFATLVKICQAKSPEHAIHGKTIASFIERMSRANDQLLKLADLISQVKQIEEVSSIDDIYNQLQRVQ